MNDKYSDMMMQKRIPRKKKKNLKRLFQLRYGCEWISCKNIVHEYAWFFCNPIGFEIKKQLR